MLKLEKVRTSTKSIGKFEEFLIKRVSHHFHELGYEVFTHARFAIAWGSNLSDVDMLLAKGDTLIVIEVKSKRDKIARARLQMERIFDYIDYGYVATDRLPKRWDEQKLGLLLIGETVKTVHKAKRLRGRPTVESLSALRKKCLLHFLGKKSNGYQLKYEIADMVRLMGSEQSLRRCLKRVVTCAERCDGGCPALSFAARNGSRSLPSSSFGYYA